MTRYPSSWIRYHHGIFSGCWDTTNQTIIYLADTKSRCIDTSGIPGIRLFSITEGDGSMPDNEKELIQARHRLEEAQARDHVKERKARTRRLIQEGAILEKVFPAAAAMELMELETELERRLRGQRGF